MGWEIGFDKDWDRDIGYGVPAKCDHPKCDADIDRGLSFACGGDDGCGLFFCEEHRGHGEKANLCEQCAAGLEPFEPSPDTKEWLHHKLTDPSWEPWRTANMDEVSRIRKQLQEA